MRYLRYLALLSIFVLPAAYSQAQVAVWNRRWPGLCRSCARMRLWLLLVLSIRVRALWLLRAAMVCGRRIHWRGPVVSRLLQARIRLLWYAVGMATTVAPDMATMVADIYRPGAYAYRGGGVGYSARLCARRSGGGFHGGGGRR